MWGLAIVIAWFIGLAALAVLEAKHFGVDILGKASILIMVVVAFAVLLLADWIVFPVAALAIALLFVPVDPETIAERRAAADDADLELERQLRRDELKQAKEDLSLGLISEEEYEKQVALIEQPRGQP